MTVPTPPPLPPEEPVKPRRRLLRWLGAAALIVASFLAGLGSGGVAQEKPAPTTEVVEIEVPGEIPADDLQWLEDERAALEARAAELDTRQAELDQRQADLDAREAAIAATEQEIAEGTVPGDGIFLVGTDIQPGTYRSTAGDCYWARLSGTSGEFSEIIANGNGAAVVTIKESDVAFESRFCGEWTAVQ